MTKASLIRNFQPSPKDSHLMNRLINPFNTVEVSGSVANGFGVIEKESLDLDTKSGERSFAKKRFTLRACLTDSPYRLLKAAKRRLGCGQTRTVRNTRLMDDVIRAT